uniref:Uncharacterized protein n=1 Tax=Rhizophagus irregularis (strain DAOM 181602 / DAOM 197198 / MUCL 43194) TaxID=747089 RepID=U9TAB2_RHIID
MAIGSLAVVIIRWQISSSNSNLSGTVSSMQNSSPPKRHMKSESLMALLNRCLDPPSVELGVFGSSQRSLYANALAVLYGWQCQSKGQDKHTPLIILHPA